MINLDAIDRVLGHSFTVLGTPVVAVDDNTARTLVAELRAAREVIRLAPRPPNFNTSTAAYVAALEAYDATLAERP